MPRCLPLYIKVISVLQRGCSSIYLQYNVYSWALTYNRNAVTSKIIHDIIQLGKKKKSKQTCWSDCLEQTV